MSYGAFDDSITAELKNHVLGQLQQSRVSPFPSPEPRQPASPPPSPCPEETSDQPPRPPPSTAPRIARRPVDSPFPFHLPGRPVPEPPPVQQQHTHETIVSYRQAIDSTDSLVQSIERTPSSKPAAPGPGNFPDGGISAWLSVVGGFCALFVSFGWAACIGDFQAYYQAHQLAAFTPSTIGWIPSFQTFLMFVLGPIFGKAFDSYGPTPVLVFGTVFHVSGLLMVSLSTQYYQIFLSQAVCSSMGVSAIFWSAGMAINTWFKTKRGIAMGLAAAGSSVGGLVGSAIIPPLFDSIGFANTLRYIAFGYLGILVVCLLTVKSRLQHKPSRFSLVALLAPLKSPDVSLLGAGAFFLMLGLYLPMNYLVVEAEAAGLSPTSASRLLVIFNVTGIPGRILMPLLGDLYGRFNITIMCIFMSAMTILAVWLPLTGEVVLVTFAALYGFFSGTLVAITATLAAQVCHDVRQVGAYMGGVHLVISPALLVTLPIGGALGTMGGSVPTPYWPMKLFGGAVLLIAGVLFVIARNAHLRVLRRVNSPSTPWLHITLRLAIS